MPKDKMTVADVHRRYRSLRRLRDEGGEIMMDEIQIMLDAFEAIAFGDTPRPRQLAAAILDEYRNKMCE